MSAATIKRKTETAQNVRKKTLAQRMKPYAALYLMLLPGLALILIFCYGPMYGLQIAFKDYNIGLGIWNSPWVGLEHLQKFLSTDAAIRALTNTIIISALKLVFSFPMPILLAVVLNEIGNQTFKRVAQTISYLPHFISLVVICGILIDIFSPQGGVVNSLLYSLTGKRINFFGEPEWFRTMYVGSGVWQEFGWNSIIYLAAITGINPDLYEAARIDGAGRLR